MATSTGSKLSGGALAFRAVAYLEAASYLALLAAVVVHRVFDGPSFTPVLGPIHGIAFLVYLVLVLVIREDQGWGFWNTILIIFLSVVPFGGFWAGRHLRQTPPPDTSAANW